MVFTGSEDHSITLQEGSRLTRNYRDNAGKNSVKAGFFGKETIQRIIDQKGCVGIRIYYGQENDGNPKLVLVGVDAKENDITKGELAEKSSPCPPDCGEANELNS